MRIFLVSPLILVHLVCLSLPAAGAALDGGSTDKGTQTDHGAVEVSGGSWLSFLNPSHLIETVKNATSTLWTPGPGSSTPDFWEVAKKCEKDLQDYVPRMLEDTANSLGLARLNQVTFVMKDMLNTTAAFRTDVNHALDAQNITFDALTFELEGIFMVIMNNLENNPPPNKTPCHAERVNIADKILDDISLAIIDLAMRLGIEEIVKTYLVATKPIVHGIIDTVGDVTEEHPLLLDIIVFSVTTLLIPESWILRPLLNIFGFGPSGPVKGSLAALMQSRLWGATVKPGSWFAFLQKAAMGGNTKGAGFFAKVSAWAVGAFGMFFGSKHE